MFDLLFAAYKDLQSREDTRNGAWQQEGWDEVVYYTGEQTKRSFTKHKVMMETTKPCDWLVLSNNISNISVWSIAKRTLDYEDMLYQL